MCATHCDLDHVNEQNSTQGASERLLCETLPSSHFTGSCIFYPLDVLQQPGSVQHILGIFRSHQVNQAPFPLPIPFMNPLIMEHSFILPSVFQPCFQSLATFLYSNPAHSPAFQVIEPLAVLMHVFICSSPWFAPCSMAASFKPGLQWPGQGCGSSPSKALL